MDRLVIIFKMILEFSLLLFLLVAGIPFGQATDLQADSPHRLAFPAKILMPIFMQPGSSHDQMPATISAGLADRGHEIHLLANSLPRDEKVISSFKASDIVYYESAFTVEEAAKFNSKIVSKYKSDPRFGGFKQFSEVLKASSVDCRSLLSDSKIIERLKNEAYDMIITEVFFPCDVLLAKYLNVPFIALSSSRELPLLRKSMFGFPAELSYTPEICFGGTDKMTFMQRVQNVFQHFFLSYVGPPILSTDYFQIQTDFGIETDTYLPLLIGQAALWLSYSDISLDFPGPVMPNFVHIGGMAVKDAEGLDKVRQ